MGETSTLSVDVDMLSGSTRERAAKRRKKTSQWTEPDYHHVSYERATLTQHDELRKRIRTRTTDEIMPYWWTCKSRRLLDGHSRTSAYVGMLECAADSDRRRKKAQRSSQPEHHGSGRRGTRSEDGPVRSRDPVAAVHRPASAHRREAVQLPARPHTAPLSRMGVDETRWMRSPRPATAGTWTSRSGGNHSAFGSARMAHHDARRSVPNRTLDLVAKIDAQMIIGTGAPTGKRSPAPEGSLRDSGYESINPADTPLLGKGANISHGAVKSSTRTFTYKPSQTAYNAVDALESGDPCPGGGPSTVDPPCVRMGDIRDSSGGRYVSSVRPSTAPASPLSARQQHSKPRPQANTESFTPRELPLESIPRRRKRVLYDTTRRLSWAYRRVAADGASDTRIDNLLCAAASCGNVAKARHLLWEGADVNGLRSLYAATPAMLALVGDHVDMVELLFEYGGHFNQPVFIPRNYVDELGAGTSRGLLQSVYRSHKVVMAKEESCLASLLVKSSRRARFELSTLHPELDIEQLQDLQCSLAAGFGEDEDDYLLVPHSIVRDFRLPDLAQGVALCYAVEHGQIQMTLRLLGHGAVPGSSAIAVRLAADQNRPELLDAMLRSCREAAAAVMADVSILQSAAFGLCEDAVDVLLQYVNSAQIKAVLNCAVARGRVAVVRMICAKTIGFDDPLDRTYGPRLAGSPPQATSMDAVRRMIESCVLQHGKVDFAQAFVLLATANIARRPAVCQLLLDAGVGEHAVVKVLRATASFEHPDATQEVDVVSPRLVAGDASVEEGPSRVLLAF